MPKKDILFTCSHCHAQYQKWVGRCLECGKWGTVQEEIQSKAKQKEQELESSPQATLHTLTQITSQNTTRLPSGMTELDTVLGGGFVPGSFILLGGEPGIGKSTLSLQIALSISDTLYFSGEESVGQIKMRSDRMKKTASNLRLSNEIMVESICATIIKQKPALAIIDSIQTIYSEEVQTEAGNIAQVRACSVKLLETAKKTGSIIILIGHVTKEGNVAGPKTLEHLVDTVLYLEGERYHNIRLLRGVKNRFGATDEIGMFHMSENGLFPIDNPSEILLSEKSQNSGSVVTCLLEGTRPLLVEVQALVNRTTFGYPVRKASGFDLNRLHVLIAVLEKRAGLSLGGYDVHVNIAGGMKASEPAADLAVCLAIASAFKDKVLGNELCVFGEVGLGGEVRAVSQLEKRIKECQSLKMKKIITKKPKSLRLTKNIPDIFHVENISELIKHT